MVESTHRLDSTGTVIRLPSKASFFQAMGEGWEVNSYRVNVTATARSPDGERQEFKFGYDLRPSETVLLEQDPNHVTIQGTVVSDVENGGDR